MYYINNNAKTISRTLDVLYLTFSRTLFVFFIWNAILPTVVGIPNSLS